METGVKLASVSLASPKVRQSSIPRTPVKKPWERFVNPSIGEAAEAGEFLGFAGQTA